jgi:hypothetical protein
MRKVIAFFHDESLLLAIWWEIGILVDEGLVEERPGFSPKPGFW